jgi:hypothetical protein
MAVAKKAAGAKKGGRQLITGGNVASMRPDELGQAGLLDDFDGVVIEARLVPWNYPTEAKPEGSIDHHILAVRLKIQPDEKDEPVVQHYSAGELEHFAPSMDGIQPVDLDGDDLDAMEGVVALRVGKKEKLAESSNWGHFLTMLGEAGFPLDEIIPDVRFIEGLYAHWNRIDQRKRSGVVGSERTDNQGNKRARQILVVTEVKERREVSDEGEVAAETTTKAAAKTTAKAKAPAKAAPAEAAASNGDLGEQLTEKLRAALLEAEDNTLQKAELSKVAIKGFPGGKEKTAAMALLKNAEYLEGLSESNIFWDGDEGTLTLVVE